MKQAHSTDLVYEETMNDEDYEEIKAGDRVINKIGGKGTATEVYPKRAIVKFDNEAYGTLSIDKSILEKILEPNNQ